MTTKYFIKIFLKLISNFNFVSFQVRSFLLEFRLQYLQNVKVIKFLVFSLINITPE